jgi:hypothetical protein
VRTESNGQYEQSRREDGANTLRNTILEDSDNKMCCSFCIDALEIHGLSNLTFRPTPRIEREYVPMICRGLQTKRISFPKVESLIESKI